MKPRWVITHAPRLSPPEAKIENRHPPQVSPPRDPNLVPWLWAQLHLRGMGYNGMDDSVWITAFGNRIPCGQCRAHWVRMMKESPPDYFDYFTWTVARHNEINAKLGKPIVSLEAARARWLQNGLVKDRG